MIKPIVIEIEEKIAYGENKHLRDKYTIEFNRKAILELEDRGFMLDEIYPKPVTMLPMLFECSLKMHQADVSPEESDALIVAISGLTNKMIVNLKVMFIEVGYATLLSAGEPPKKGITIRM